MKSRLQNLFGVCLSPYLFHPPPGLPDAGRGGVDDPDGVPGPVWGGEQEPGDEEPGSEPGGLLEEAEHQAPPGQEGRQRLHH